MLAWWKGSHCVVWIYSVEPERRRFSLRRIAGLLLRDHCSRLHFHQLKIFCPLGDPGRSATGTEPQIHIGVASKHETRTRQ